MPLLTQALRFGLTGVLNTLVDVAAFTAFVHVAGLAAAPANVMSYSIGIVCSFILNNSWTFEARTAPGASHRFVRFVLVSLSALALSTAIVATAVHFTTPLTAKLVSLPGTYLWNFVLCRKFVFRQTSAL